MERERKHVYQPTRFITDQTGGHKLEVSLPGGRYQLTLQDRAVNILQDDLGLETRDKVPETFVPFFVAIGDAWFPREHDPDQIIKGLQTGDSVTEHERNVLTSYVTDSRISQRNAERVRSVLERSPISDAVHPDDLHIEDLPDIPDWVDFSDSSSMSAENEGSAQTQSSPETAESDSDLAPNPAEENFQQIPGIGPERARSLAEGNVGSLAQLAESRPVDLASISGISEGIAAVAVEGARELLGETTPISERLADETNQDEEVFSSALSVLATAGIPGKEAAPTLQVLFGPNIADIDNVNGYQAYFLWEAGYRTPSDIIAASTEELSEVYQIGETSAESIKKSASDLVDGEAVY